MSMRIQAVNGRCPCRRCQDMGNPLADFGLIGPALTMPAARLPIILQVRRLLAIVRSGQR